MSDFKSLPFKKREEKRTRQLIMKKTRILTDGLNNHILLMFACSLALPQTVLLSLRTIHPEARGFKNLIPL